MRRGSYVVAIRRPDPSPLGEGSRILASVDELVVLPHAHRLKRLHTGVFGASMRVMRWSAQRPTIARLAAHGRSGI
ncbi:hypothetical protein CHELA20_10444 [Hyphomicrobiales bacterium]|nr:hypothetical protein CHELA20_10444 [Hyphomicrobiales bacterium]CAH1692215.1 hypothetical protein CHELA41_50670 [Hyphomicrobiales bacterium]